MKIISQEEWCLLCRSDFTAKVEEIIGTRCNPNENDIDMDECPEDAVVITEDIIDELNDAAEDWYDEAKGEDEDEQRAANAMIEFARDLRVLEPQRNRQVTG